MLIRERHWMWLCVLHLNDAVEEVIEVFCMCWSIVCYLCHGDDDDDDDGTHTRSDVFRHVSSALQDHTWLREESCTSAEITSVLLSH